MWLDGYMLYVAGTSYKENKRGQFSEKSIQTSWKNQGRITFEICWFFFFSFAFEGLGDFDDRMKSVETDQGHIKNG